MSEPREDSAAIPTHPPTTPDHAEAPAETTEGRVDDSELERASGGTGGAMHHDNWNDGR